MPKSKSLPLKVMDFEPDLIWEKSRRSQVVAARYLPRYWASKELGMSATDLAKRLKLTQPAVALGCAGGKAR